MPYHTTYDDDSESDFERDELPDLNDEDTDEDEKSDTEMQPASSSQQPASSKKRAASPATPKLKKAKYKHTDPISIEQEPNQEIYKLYADKLGLHYYATREFLTSAEHYVSSLYKKCSQEELTTKLTRSIYTLASTLRSHKRKATTPANRSKEEILADAVKGQGDSEFDKQLNALKQSLNSDNTNHDMITYANTFLSSHELKSLTGYLEAAGYMNKDKHRETIIKEAFIHLFNDLTSKLVNISAAQLNQVFFLINAIIRNVFSEKRSNATIQKQLAASKKTTALAQLARKNMGIESVAKSTAAKSTAAKYVPRIEKAQDAFKKEVNAHKEVYKFFAEIGYTVYDAEDYIVRLQETREKKHERTSKLLVPKLLDDHSDLNKTKLTNNFEKITEQFKVFTGAIQKKYKRTNASDKLTSDELAAIPSSRIMSKSGNTTLNDIITNLVNDTLSDDQFSRLGLTTDGIRELLINSEKAKNWKTRELRAYKYIFTDLFRHLTQKFPDATALQINQLHIPLAMKVIELRIQKQISEENARGRQSRKLAANLAVTLYGGNSSAAAAVAAEPTHSGPSQPGSTP